MSDWWSFNFEDRNARNTDIGMLWQPFLNNLVGGGLFNRRGQGTRAALPKVNGTHLVIYIFFPSNQQITTERWSRNFQVKPVAWHSRPNQISYADNVSTQMTDNVLEQVINDQKSNMFRPPVNRAMRVLDRSFFKKHIPLSAARVYDPRTISKIRTQLEKSKDILDQRMILPIRLEPHPEVAGRKCILLRPEIRHDGEWHAAFDSGSGGPNADDFCRSIDVECCCQGTSGVGRCGTHAVRCAFGL